MIKMNSMKISSPGRICLFGEHQDYLDLDVVAAAISLRFYVEGQERSDDRFIINLPDTGEKDEFQVRGELPYYRKRDYLRSTVNVLLRLGCRFSSGWDITMHGEIPINAGTSSSSAMVVAWTRFLLEAAGRYDLAQNPEQVAELAHLAEVVEFKEPGGKMDHYTSAVGGLVWIKFLPRINLTGLKVQLGKFVLGDSLEKKDTTGTLGSVRERVNVGLQFIKKIQPDFNLREAREEEILRLGKSLPAEIKNPLIGAVINRDLTREGLRLFQSTPFDHREFGRLLNEHQKVLRELVGISTPKIDRILEAAIKAGAYGGKINGSGLGGCMFVYAPEDPQRVARAIEQAGGRPFLIDIDEGLRREH